MKKRMISTFALALSIPFFLAFAISDDKKPESLEVGDSAPMTDHSMQDISGKSYALASIKKDNGLLVIFSCNTCPFVVGNAKMGEGWQTRYNDLQSSCDDHNIGMVLVNSNEAKRSGDKTDDSMDAMIAHAEEEGYTSLYVLDKDHVLADAFGARTTPHVFLFNGDMTLVYKGAIDDSFQSSEEVKEPWLLNALKNLAAGRDIDPSETRNKGCSIKRLKS